MKNYEKKSLVTTIALFFIPLLILASIVLYMYQVDKIKDIEQNILYKMKDYTFDFKGDEFSLDIVQDDKQKNFLKYTIVKRDFVPISKSQQLDHIF